MNKLVINIYSDIKNEWKFNGFKNNNSFLCNRNSANDIEFLDKILVKEKKLERHSKNNDLGFDEQFRSLVISNILIPRKKTIAVITEFQIDQVSKLRSYKGILNKELKKNSEYLEEEVLVVQNQSIIGNLVIVTIENIEIILDNYFGDSDRCCFLITESSVFFQKDFLHKVLKDCLVHKNTSVINYFSLCKDLKKNDQIIRIGGDGYDEVSLQEFKLK